MPKTIIHPSAPGIWNDWATRPPPESRARSISGELFARLRHSGRALRRAAAGRRLVLAATLLLCAPLAAAADEPPRAIAMEGATLRLVAEAPTTDGAVRAALLIDLAPGWKTYWLDPGAAGIPPHLDLSRSTNLVQRETEFPVPHRASDGYGTSNVYSQPLAVALSLRKPDAAAPAAIDLGITLGLCRDICIPVATRLRLDLAKADPADARLVAYAFDALPEESTSTAGLRSARLSEDGRTIEVEVLAPDDHPVRSADLFLARPGGWFFGTPEVRKREGRSLVFAVPVTARPKSAGSAPPPAVDAVLSLGARAFRAANLPVEAAR